MPTFLLLRDLVSCRILHITRVGGIPFISVPHEIHSHLARVMFRRDYRLMLSKRDY
uniref:Uncharacterized protein n=1 Tax=Rhizophora mucronata TaxID=61149 RepID=A0A2P2IIG4_RHIMU